MSKIWISKTVVIEISNSYRLCNMIDKIKLYEPNLIGWAIWIRKTVVIDISTSDRSSDMIDKILKNCKNLIFSDERYKLGKQLSMKLLLHFASPI